MKIYSPIILALLSFKGIPTANAFVPSVSYSPSSLVNHNIILSSPSTTELKISGTRNLNRNNAKSNTFPSSSKKRSLQTTSAAEVTISSTDSINPFFNTQKIAKKSSSPSSLSETEESNEYKLGLTIIGFITLMFSSNSPVLHAAFVNSSNPPSVLLLNTATSSIALVGLILFGPVLNSVIPLPSALKENQNYNDGNGDDFINNYHDHGQSYLIAGTELGFWKTLGTTANLYGLSLTSANHAAFLIQLTTLIVPSVQGLMGVPVPQRIWTSIALALSGIFLFTQDMTAVSSSAEALLGTDTVLLGDALCVVAAAFYATYDLRLFDYGKKVPPLPLIRTKIAVQAFLSCVMLAVLGEHDGLNEIITYVTSLLSSSSSDLTLVGSAVLWSGLVINALVPFLQVSGQQIVGASRAQVVYASQPLWAAILSFVFLGETLGENGMMGGFLFLTAIFLAASAGSPDADCETDICEV